jgi:hypothetical protein
MASQRGREYEIIPSREPSLGLCSTCNSRAICMRCKGIKLPVLFCEEFDNATSRDVERPPILVTRDAEAPLDIAMGLCCTCGNRDSCTSHNSPGGVWHCEEFC